MLVQHSNASAGVPAWQGIIAAATVFAEYDHARAPQASTTSLMPSSQLPAGTDAAAGFGGSQDSRQNSVVSLEASAMLSSSLFTVLPAVMAYYSCSTGSAAQATASSMAQQSNVEPERHSAPVLKLCSAEARAIAPFIAALVAHCQQGMEQSGLSKEIHEPSTNHDTVQPDDCPLSVEGSAPSESTKLVHKSRSDADGMNCCCSDRLVAAIEMLLTLSEEHTLLAHTLRLLQPLHKACISFRYATGPL